VGCRRRGRNEPEYELIDTGMWDEEGGFFYDVLGLPDGRAQPAQGPVDGRTVTPLRRHHLRWGSHGEVGVTSRNGL
jgi:hypothetical protein